MSRESRMHELLPWYLTGALDPGETEEFRRHLEDCVDCREEAEFLKRVRAELDEHGKALLEDHPDAGQLVAVVRGELEGEEARKIRRHLALCSACATEARWIRGDAETATPLGSGRAPGRRGARWGVAAAALAAMLALVVWLPRLGGGATSDVVRGHYLVPVQRSTETGPTNRFVLQDGVETLRLILEVDFARDAFPLALSISDEAGREVLARGGLEADWLLEGNLLVDCSRSDCSPGSYTLEVRSESDPADRLTYPFRVVEP